VPVHEKGDQRSDCVSDLTRLCGAEKALGLLLSYKRSVFVAVRYISFTNFHEFVANLYIYRFSYKVTLPCLIAAFGPARILVGLLSDWQYFA
jgi:hypothetical protein